MGITKKLVGSCALLSAMLFATSCGLTNGGNGGYKKITAEEAYEILEKNLEKDAGYTGATVTDKLEKFSLSFSKELKDMAKDEGVDLSELEDMLTEQILGDQKVGEEHTEEYDASEVDYFRFTSLQDEAETDGVTFYANGDKLKLEVEYEDEETESGMTMTMKMAATYFIDEYGYRSSLSATVEESMSMGVSFTMKYSQKYTYTK